MHCHCDDPRISKFFHYFSYNFERQGGCAAENLTGVYSGANWLGTAICCVPLVKKLVLRRTLLGLKKLVTACYRNQERDLFSRHDSERAI